MSEKQTIRKKTHRVRQLIVMPRYGTKTIVERIITISLPHISAVDGPLLPEGKTA